MAQLLIEQYGCRVTGDAVLGAAQSGNFELMKYLHTTGIQVDYGAMASAKFGRLSWIKYFLDHNARPHTALLEAAKLGDLETTRFILEQVENPLELIESPDVLAAAARSGNIELLNYLLSDNTLSPKTLDDALQSATFSLNRRAITPLLNAGASYKRCYFIDPRLRPSDRSFLRMSEAIAKIGQRRSGAAAGQELLKRMQCDSLSPLFRDGLLGSPRWSETNLYKIALLCAEASSKCSTNEAVAKRLFRSLLPEQLTQMQHSKAPVRETIGQLKSRVSELELFGDVVDRVSSEVVIPVWAALKTVSEKVRDLDYYQATSLATRARVFTAEQLAQGRSIQQLIKLTRLFHRPVAALPVHCTPFKSGEVWPPLFTEPLQLSDGYSMVALDSQMALRREGSELDHCVGDGTYATGCSSGQRQIISVRHLETPVATLDLALTHDGEGIQTHSTRRWRIAQYRGFNNQHPDAGAKKALEEFLELVSNQAIPFNPQVEYFTGARNFKNSNISPIERLTGIPLNEPELVDEIMSHYKKIEQALGMPVLPRTALNIEQLNAVLSPALNPPRRRSKK
jgi:hypothetical protein